MHLAFLYMPGHVCTLKSCNLLNCEYVGRDTFKIQTSHEMHIHCMSVASTMFYLLATILRRREREREDLPVTSSPEAWLLLSCTGFAHLSLPWPTG